MRQSQLFPRTKKEPPKDAESINHSYLVQAGYIDQLMSGSWTLMPLGWRVVDKINDIIRDELNKTGAQEILMPLLHPKEIWNETGRWDKADEIMYKLLEQRGKDYVLSFTHEEIFLDLVRKHIESYNDLPLALYHFSTKFRNEPRARSGILRGREFMMKDLYSLHDTEEDFNKYYQDVIEAYERIFERMGFDYKITEAGGGVFTKNITHEFQVPAEGGEDNIYYCKECTWAVNEEVFDPQEVEEVESEESKTKCPRCGGEVVHSKSIEVGNVFSFGTEYSKKMNVRVTDAEGKKKHPYFGSYGIGSTRVMGTWVEVSHDECGIIWHSNLSPFDVHLIELPGGNGEQVYNELTSKGIEVLWDDREVNAGEKFADSDLIGIPYRLVTSTKTGDQIELKERKAKSPELMDLEKLISIFK